MKKLVAVTLCAALSVGMMTGCGKEEKKADDSVIKIGVLAPLTGTNAEYGN